MREILAWAIVGLFGVWMIREALRERPCEVCGEVTRGRRCKRHRGL